MNRSRKGKNQNVEKPHIATPFLNTQSTRSNTKDILVVPDLVTQRATQINDWTTSQLTELQKELHTILKRVKFEFAQHNLVVYIFEWNIHYQQDFDEENLSQPCLWRWPFCFLCVPTKNPEDLNQVTKRPLDSISSF